MTWPEAAFASGATVVGLPILVMVSAVVICWVGGVFGGSKKVTWHSYLYWLICWLWDAEWAEKDPNWPYERCPEPFCHTYYLKGEKCPDPPYAFPSLGSCHEVAQRSYDHWAEEASRRDALIEQKRATDRRIEAIAKKMGIE